MSKFKIETVCANCNNNTFKLFDVVSVPQKTVLELSRVIAAQGFVNTSKFQQQCTKCRSFKVKLIYTQAKK